MMGLIGFLFALLFLSVAACVGRRGKVFVTLHKMEAYTHSCKGNFQIHVYTKTKLPIACKLKLWIEVKNTLNGDKKLEKKTIYYTGTREAIYPFFLENTWSGGIQLQILQIQVLDWFGLLRLKSKRKTPNTFWNTSMCFLPGKTEKYDLQGDSMQGKWSSLQTVKGLSLNGLDGLREYVSGEPLRHIHWRATQKWNTLYIKEYEKENHCRGTLQLCTAEEFPNWTFDKLEEEFRKVHSQAMVYLQEGHSFYASKKGRKKYLIENWQQWCAFISVGDCNPD